MTASDVGLTRWHIFILPAHEMPQGGDAPALLLVADTDDPRMVAMIEEAARDHGVLLERVRA
jgi:hypothetical protein